MSNLSDNYKCNTTTQISKNSWLHKQNCQTLKHKLSSHQNWDLNNFKRYTTSGNLETVMIEHQPKPFCPRWACTLVCCWVAVLSEACWRLTPASLFLPPLVAYVPVSSRGTLLTYVEFLGLCCPSFGFLATAAFGESTQEATTWHAPVFKEPFSEV